MVSPSRWGIEPLRPLPADGGSWSAATKSNNHSEQQLTKKLMGCEHVVHSHETITDGSITISTNVHTTVLHLCTFLACLQKCVWYKNCLLEQDNG